MPHAQSSTPNGVSVTTLVVENAAKHHRLSHNGCFPVLEYLVIVGLGLGSAQINDQSRSRIKVRGRLSAEEVRCLDDAGWGSTKKQSGGLGPTTQSAAGGR